MDPTNSERKPACSIGCGCCPAVTGELPEGGPAGWKLVLGSIWAFLMPGVLALVGLGVLPILWPHRDSPVVGGMGGLLLGMLLAGLVGRWLARRRAKRTQPANPRIHEATN